MLLDVVLEVPDSSRFTQQAGLQEGTPNPCHSRHKSVGCSYIGGMVNIDPDAAWPQKRRVAADLIEANPTASM
jgi:hypothetical protein